MQHQDVSQRVKNGNMASKSTGEVGIQRKTKLKLTLNKHLFKTNLEEISYTLCTFLLLLKIVRSPTWTGPGAKLSHRSDILGKERLFP